MDTATAPAPRPLSQQRPTQAYYVPRKLLECGRGPAPSVKEAGKVQPKVENADTPKKVRKSPSGDRAQSPKETNNNEKKENVKPKKVSPLQISPKVRGEPRPLMAELVPKPDSLKEKKNRRRRNSPQKTEGLVPLVQKLEGLTTSEPRIISPKNGALPLVRPNPFSPMTEPKKDICICHRPECQVICRSSETTSLLANRKATPFHSRKSPKKATPDVEPMVLFNSVRARPFLTGVLFVKLVLISLLAHYILTESAWHLQQGRSTHNPVYIAIPTATVFIIMAMIAIGTGVSLLMIPYLIIQVLSNVMLAIAVGSISWFHFREFFTRKEVGIAVVSFMLPLWLWTYITVAAFRLFFYMLCKIDQKTFGQRLTDVENGIDFEDEDIILFERPRSSRTNTTKKRVRFLDIIGRKK